MTVQELQTALLPRLAKGKIASGITLMQAVNMATHVIHRRLWDSNSDILHKAFTLYIPGTLDNAKLPSDFLGLSEHPYVSGQGNPLTPVQSKDRAALDGQSGTPTYYELVDDRLYVFPTPVSLTLIKGRYILDEPTVDALTDAIPFAGLFDQLYVEAVLWLNTHGLSATIDPGFDALVRNEVDRIHPLRKRGVRRATAHFL